MGSAEQVQDFAEEVPELSVENSVNDGVDGTVDVTQPSDSAGDLRGNGAGLAESPCNVDHKKRRPAEEESTCQEDIKERKRRVKKGLR